ncbi:protein of unknown function [Georgfuchsia toluolica]|uniref:Uncharacterized protein n=1 Tax=Georgfuchsia toluolica TaxID=424218 RepID=A0A916N8Y4_9PROT|nr:protein of unknown function [Georgfuchsia toluolica]
MEDGEKNHLVFMMKDRLTRDRKLVRTQLSKLPRSELIENFVPRLIERGKPLIQE